MGCQFCGTRLETKLGQGRTYRGLERHLDSFVQGQGFQPQLVHCSGIGAVLGDEAEAPQGIGQQFLGEWCAIEPDGCSALQSPIGIKA